MEKAQKRFEIDIKKIPSCQPGTVKEKNGIRFTLSVPEGEKATLVLYDKESKDIVSEIAFPAEACTGNLHSMKVTELSWRDYLYNYRIGDKIICDPYAKLLADRNGAVNADAYCELIFDSFDWKEDRKPDLAYSDTVIYHLHVRNFTMGSGSGVRHKGTFLGLQEKIKYLKELGINQVKLMPVYEYGLNPNTESKLEERYIKSNKNRKKDCWGYSKGSYFAVNRKYAATANPVKEFKNMVKAFHENGMEVILDMFFPADVSVRMILDCLSYWSCEYHVDGFHIFGRDDSALLLAGDPVLASCKILVPGLPENGKKKNGKFVQCNDGFLVEARKLLKGDEGILEAFVCRSRINPAGSGTINYVINHDGFTLMDLVSYDTKHNEDNGEDNRDGAEYNFSWNCGVEGPSSKKAVLALRRRQMKNAFLMMFLAQGTPMIMSGDEFGNSQKGNNNPYCLDNEISWVDWKAYRRNRKLTEFVQKAIDFRKEHRILHMDKEPGMTDYKSWGYPDLSYHSNRAWYSGFEYDNRQVGMMYCGKYVDTDEYVYIAYNLNPLEQELALPKLPLGYAWHKAIDTSLEESFIKEEEQEVLENIRSCVFPARSISVLIGKKVK
ncbi:MAG: alpha-amylase family glycosyl hydrolase [Eubacteriales bacterium]|nr:alpha-amylase family glycosyl hydrolase [Eubacteriales bacterium]